MLETWLRPNRRAIWLGCIPPLVLAAGGAWLALQAAPSASAWLRWLGIVMGAAGVAIIAFLMRQLRRPRIAFRGGRVLFYLRAGSPIDTPVEIVEAFFLGQGPARLPAGAHMNAPTVNLVARLSQREKEWARRDVKPALGSWCDGYVTIRGTWCEPLDGEVVRRLNRRLKEVKSRSVRTGPE